MMKKNVCITTLLIVLLVCFTMLLTACFSGNIGAGVTKPEKSFTISCATEMMAGDRVEITITKSYDFDMYHDDYEWYIVGENTVGGSFEFENLDEDSNYTNKFFRATKPGKVSIQATNSTSGDLVSNIVEITVKGNYINTVEELKAIANTNKAYILGSDIDLSSESNWTPIEGFTGTLSGGGHSISNLTINSVNDENIGLFSVLLGEVNDLTIENAQISYRGDTGKIGIVAGTCSGTIEGVQVSGTVSASYAENVGGIVGYLNNGKLKDNTNLAEVRGANNTGGIAGYASIKENNGIDGNVNQGQIIGADNVGGIAGNMTCFSDDTTKNYTYMISNLVNDGEVEGTTKIGGIFGQLTASRNKYYSRYYDNYFIVSLLTNRGTVTASGDCVGGLIGFAERVQTLDVSDNIADIQGANFVGGFVGYSVGIKIDCGGFVNNSVIIGKGIVGGIAGRAGIISNAKNAGFVMSESIYIEDNESYAYVGGIAGIAKGVINCVNEADVAVSHTGKYVGGIVGKCIISENGVFSGNRNYGDITGAEGVGGIAGMITCPDKGTKTTDTYDVISNENNGSIQGDTQVGGIIGYVNAVENVYYSSRYSNYFALSECKNSGEIVSDGDYAGGIAGYAIGISTATLCENFADITGGSFTGGLFGSAAGANIKAVGVENVNVITGKSYVGGFAGYAGIIEDAIGSSYGSIISTSSTVEDSEQVAYVGGIAGYCTGLINCVNSTSIEVPHSGKYVAGLSGYLYLTEFDQAKNNKNEGDISGAEYVGGIAGYICSIGKNTTKKFTYTVTENENLGQVQSSGYAGGIAAYVYATPNHSWSTYYYNKIQVTNCRNEGNILGSVAGGIVGGYYYLDTSDAVMSTNYTSFGEKLGQ